MANIKSRISDYKAKSAISARRLHDVAAALERGDLPVPGTGRKLGNMLQKLETLGCGLCRAIDKPGTDCSAAPVTIDSLEEEYKRRASMPALQQLDAIQLIETDTAKFAAPMQELQKRASAAAEALRGGGGLSDMDKKTVDQASAVLAVMDAEDSDSASEQNEKRFADLGIGDTILLGLILGKYTRAAPLDETAAVKDGALSTPVVSGDEATRAEDPDWSVIASDTVGPLRRLLPAKASAKKFIKDATQIGLETVSAFLVEVAETHLLSLDHIMRDYGAQTAGSMPPNLEKSIRERLLMVLKRMTSCGILAAYRLGDNAIAPAGEIVLVMTPYTLANLKTKSVQRALRVGPDLASTEPSFTASEQMPLSRLIAWWAFQEAVSRRNEWIHSLTLRPVLSSPYAGRTSMTLPEEYGTGEQAYKLWPYEWPESPSNADPVLYVVVSDAADPLTSDRTVEAGSLLLYKGVLYERSGGAWVEKERNAPGSSEEPEGGESPASDKPEGKRAQAKPASAASGVKA